MLPMERTFSIVNFPRKEGDPLVCNRLHVTTCGKITRQIILTKVVVSLHPDYLTQSLLCRGHNFRTADDSPINLGEYGANRVAAD